MYFVKTPFWLKKWFNHYHWDIETNEQAVYLTFDDGPHPLATPFVLEQLDRFNAKATFFCIGKNVAAHKGIYEEILQRGHSVGNHTHNHLNGWKTPHQQYINNVDEAARNITSTLFRPPYGRITKKAGRTLINKGFKVIMWDVLSADFDRTLSPEKCRDIVIKKSQAGSVIVFHDSQKAFKNLQVALPATLQYFSERGFVFKNITGNDLKK